MNRTLSAPVSSPSKPPPKARGQDIFMPRWIRPWVGRCRPDKILIKVDLPAPFRPMIAIRSPIPTLNEMPSRTRRLPPPSVGNSLITLMASMVRRGIKSRAVTARFSAAGSTRYPAADLTGIILASDVSQRVLDERPDDSPDHECDGEDPERPRSAVRVGPIVGQIGGGDRLDENALLQGVDARAFQGCERGHERLFREGLIEDKALIFRDLRRQRIAASRQFLPFDADLLLQRVDLVLQGGDLRSAGRLLFDVRQRCIGFGGGERQRCYRVECRQGRLGRVDRAHPVAKISHRVQCLMGAFFGGLDLVERGSNRVGARALVQAVDKRLRTLNQSLGEALRIERSKGLHLQRRHPRAVLVIDRDESQIRLEEPFGGRPEQEGWVSPQEIRFWTLKGVHQSCAFGERVHRVAGQNVLPNDIGVIRRANDRRSLYEAAELIGRARGGAAHDEFDLGFVSVRGESKEIESAGERRQGDQQKKQRATSNARSPAAFRRAWDRSGAVDSEAHQLDPLSGDYTLILAHSKCSSLRPPHSRCASATEGRPMAKRKRR